MYLPRLIAGDMLCIDRDRFGDVPMLQAGLSNRRSSYPMRSYYIFHRKIASFCGIVLSCKKSSGSMEMAITEIFLYVGVKIDVRKIRQSTQNITNQ